MLERDQRERLLLDKSASAELLRWGKRRDDMFVQAIALARMNPTPTRWDEIIAFAEYFSDEEIDLLEPELSAWPDSLRVFPWAWVAGLTQRNDPIIKLIRSLGDFDALDSVEQLQALFSSPHLNLPNPLTWARCYLEALASINSQGCWNFTFILDKLPNPVTNKIIIRCCQHLDDEFRTRRVYSSDSGASLRPSKKKSQRSGSLSSCDLETIFPPRTFTAKKRTRKQLRKKISKQQRYVRLKLQKNCIKEKDYSKQREAVCAVLNKFIFYRAKNLISPQSQEKILDHLLQKGFEPLLDIERCRINIYEVIFSTTSNYRVGLWRNTSWNYVIESQNGTTLFLYGGLVRW